jgi:4'-phosphopantetheinyl transferase
MNITDPGFKVDAPLALPEDEVQLWRVDLEAIRSDESRWQRLLSTDERKRASRFHFPRDRQCFVASRALLRTILAAYLNADPNNLSFFYSNQEKPSLGPTHADSGITFNVSHSGAIALYAFTRRREVGVDVEHVRRDFDVEAIARRFLLHGSRGNSPIYPPKNGLMRSFVAGRSRRPTSKRLGTA